MIPFPYMIIFLTILKIAGSLGLFLYGMKILSEGLQKATGNRMKNVLHMMTHNRLMAVLTGLLVTVLIQSSSATTVMVVSFVNAGLIGLVPAIGVILGANIGTTVTGWIVALIGFKVDITIVALASVAIALPMMFIKNVKLKDLAEIFLGFGLLFLGLEFLQGSMPDLTQHVELLSWLQQFNSGSVGMILTCVLIGTLITIVVQSSSATMAITLTMAFQGWIGVNAACALILGQNIGTTITAYIASIGASTAAKRAAWSHIIFNVVGSVLAIIFFRPLVTFVNTITPGDILAMHGEDLQHNLPTFLAMFHTIFNVINTVLFFPFVKQFAHLIEKLIPAKEEYDEDSYHFQYVGGTFVDTPELYMLTIRDEITKMADLACNMFKRYRTLFNNPNVDMGGEVKALKRMEEYADQMQEQLSDFCVHLLQDSQTPTNASSLNCLIRVMDELESITDSCYNLIILSERRYNNQWQFAPEISEKLQEYESLVQEFLDYIRDHMDRTLTKSEMQRANDFEQKINEWRYALSDVIQNRLNTGVADVKVELLALEKVRHLEHIGDYCTNIAEAYHQAVKHTPVLQRRR